MNSPAASPGSRRGRGNDGTWIIAGLLVVYLMSPIPVLWAAQHFGGRTARDVLKFTVYAPVMIVCMLIPPIDLHFYSRQDEWLREKIGDP